MGPPSRDHAGKRHDLAAAFSPHRSKDQRHTDEEERAQTAWRIAEEKDRCERSDCQHRADPRVNSPRKAQNDKVKQRLQVFLGRRIAR